MVAFHSQQAIEKCIKALLEFEEKHVPKIHKLQTLIFKLDYELHIEDKILVELDDLYIDARYPTDLGLLPNGKPSLDSAELYFDTAMYCFKKTFEIIGVEYDSF